MVPLHFLTTIMPFMSRCQRSSLHGISKCREREEMWKIKMKKKIIIIIFSHFLALLFRPIKDELCYTHVLSPAET